MARCLAAPDWDVSVFVEELGSGVIAAEEGSV